MSDAVKEELVKRSRKVAFMGVVSEDTETFTRMTKFTDFSKSSNPTEYSRQYVDEDGEVTDVTGYSPEISYAFDYYTNNAVHSDIIDITDNEKTGDDAVRNIIIVDFTRPVESQRNQYYGKKRPYAIIPDSEGDSTDAYTYSGTLRNKGAFEEVKVQSSDGWKTCTVVVSTLNDNQQNNEKS